MKLFGWISGSRKHDERTTASRHGGEPGQRHWTRTAPRHRSGAAPGALRPDLDVEIELEMLDALEHLREAQQAAAAGSLPLVETHHRVIGTERCHFTAPASLPSDEHHANGRLLLTSGRAVFVGGARSAAAPWHSVHEIVRVERDVLLLRADRSPAAHYRFNTYTDAVLCAFLAGRLRRAR